MIARRIVRSLAARRKEKEYGNTRQHRKSLLQGKPLVESNDDAGILTAHVATMLYVMIQMDPMTIVRTIIRPRISAIKL